MVGAFKHLDEVYSQMINSRIKSIRKTLSLATLITIAVVVQPSILNFFSSSNAQTESTESTFSLCNWAGDWGCTPIHEQQ